jgi:hypothetical protein
LVIDRTLANTLPASGKRSAESHVVLTQIGVRSASRTD